MIDDFLIRAILAGIGVAIAAGFLGSFVVWKKMSFFGDALAHSALLGIALSLALGLSPIWGVLFIATAFALLIVTLQKQKSYSGDTLLGVISHSSLALGLVLIALVGNVQVDLMSFLFGDILAVNIPDIVTIYIGTAISLGLLALMWRPLLLATISEDLAKVEGVNVNLVRLGFMLLVAVFVALSIKIVGILLVSALLIIPAATARKFSETPERMVVIAALIGCAAVILGLFMSLHFNTPAGASIVVAALGLFMFSSVVRR
jgi:zinc transport system permease protein